MKTFFEKLLTHLELISLPASGWLFKSTETRKRKSSKEFAHTGYSPESYNIRGASSKKQSSNRHTPAP